jgi:hypothetical protein
MRALRFRVRTLMAAVGLAAVLVWAAMMGFRSYVHYALASKYRFQESMWREQAVKYRSGSEDSLATADFCAQMASKHRRAMWRPWTPVAPDPLYYFPPGARAYAKRHPDALDDLPPEAKAYLKQ